MDFILFHKHIFDWSLNYLILFLFSTFIVKVCPFVYFSELRKFQVAIFILVSFSSSWVDNIIQTVIESLETLYILTHLAF